MNPLLIDAIIKEELKPVMRDFRRRAKYMRKQRIKARQKAAAFRKSCKPVSHTAPFNAGFQNDEWEGGAL